jgi:hypothetical protein
VAATGVDHVDPKSSENDTKMGLLAWFESIQEA